MVVSRCVQTLTIVGYVIKHTLGYVIKHTLESELSIQTANAVINYLFYIMITTTIWDTTIWYHVFYL